MLRRKLLSSYSWSSKMADRVIVSELLRYMTFKYGTTQSKILKKVVLDFFQPSDIMARLVGFFQNENHFVINWTFVPPVPPMTIFLIKTKNGDY